MEANQTIKPNIDAHICLYLPIRLKSICDFICIPWFVYACKCLPVGASLGSLRSPRSAFWGFLSNVLFCARAIFRSGPNIWFLEPPERRFKAFLAPGPKPLPERLIFIAREPFFGLDRISIFWSLQQPVLMHFWPLAQNHCQNGSFSLRGGFFVIWSESN